MDSNSPGSSMESSCDSLISWTVVDKEGRGSSRESTPELDANTATEDALNKTLTAEDENGTETNSRVASDGSDIETLYYEDHPLVFNQLTGNENSTEPPSTMQTSELGWEGIQNIIHHMLDPLDADISSEDEGEDFAVIGQKDCEPDQSTPTSFADNIGEIDPVLMTQIRRQLDRIAERSRHAHQQDSPLHQGYDAFSDIDLSARAELPVNMSSIKPAKKYIHRPNPKINTMLNVLLALAFAAVVGLGIGHFYGWNSGTLQNWKSFMMQKQKLTTLSQKYEHCQYELNDDIDQDDWMIRKLRDENKQLLKLRDDNLELLRTLDEIREKMNIDERKDLKVRLNQLQHENEELKATVAKLRYKQIPEQQHTVNTQKNSINALQGENQDLREVIGKLRYSRTINNNFIVDDERLTLPYTPLLQYEEVYDRINSSSQLVNPHVIFEQRITKSDFVLKHTPIALPGKPGVNFVLKPTPIYLPPPDEPRATRDAFDGRLLEIQKQVKEARTNFELAESFEWPTPKKIEKIDGIDYKQKYTQCVRSQQESTCWYLSALVDYALNFDYSNSAANLTKAVHESVQTMADHINKSNISKQFQDQFLRTIGLFQDAQQSIKKKWSEVDDLCNSSPFKEYYKHTKSTASKMANMLHTTVNKLTEAGKKLLKKQQQPAEKLIYNFGRKVDDIKSGLEKRWKKVKSTFVRSVSRDENNNNRGDKVDRKRKEKESARKFKDTKKFTSEQKKSILKQDKYSKRSYKEKESDWMFKRGEYRGEKRREQQETDWLFDRARHRNERRKIETESDWMFDRSRGRDEKRDRQKTRYKGEHSGGKFNNFKHDVISDYY